MNSKSDIKKPQPKKVLWQNFAVSLFFEKTWKMCFFTQRIATFV
jgi:hypothetical protein